MNNSGMNTVLIIIVLILIVGGGFWWYTNYGPNAKPAQTTNGLQINLGQTSTQ